jgi:N-acetylglucosaminyldiphosphoundecaprenol N-acetyl-beta-D-mannosaminyltransferase
MTATMRRADHEASPAPERGAVVRTWPRVRYGEVAVDALRFGEVLELLQQRMADGHGGYVVTPNTDHLVKAKRNPTLAPIYDNAVLSLADGMPLVWMARLLRLPVSEKVSGSDLLLPLLEASAAAEAPVFFLGSTPTVAQRAAEVARQQIPGFRFVGSASPMVSLDGDQQPVLDALDQARHAGARLIVIALGCPKQEHVMSHHGWRVPHATLVGLGASLEFLAGELRRAPSWVSRLGLEWAFRLLQEPRRMWRRYLVDSFSALPVFATMVRARWRSGPTAASPARPANATAAPSPSPRPVLDLTGPVPVAADRGERRRTG